MIDYSIVTKDETQSATIRGTVKSFNLDHVTEKDLTSFYVNFSKYAFIDTGLLPLDGTGLLAYRQAGNHCQVVVQHVPGVSRIIWGKYENDTSAQTYHLAQPYRIYIGDLLDGNFYGARMFYSPVPITSPNQVLYHVNLPNINCKGYRGNAVGWVCLYHNENWTDIPLGEKVFRIIERCSGSEAYNDNNMSETDGPRFYRDHYSARAMNNELLADDYKYLWDPFEWHKKTDKDGFQWTLNESLWIPVLVQDKDNQSQHYHNGTPLTLGMAITGDYAAYYSDKNKTKPVNAIARKDKEFKDINSFAFIKKAYADSAVINKSSDFYNPYESVESLRENYFLTAKSHSKVVDAELEEDVLEIENEYVTCSCCQHDTSKDDAHVVQNYYYCPDCFEENCVYVASRDEHYHTDYVTYIDRYGEYFHNDDIVTCSNCDSHFHLDYVVKGYQPYWNNDKEEYDLCTECIKSPEQQIGAIPCAKCDDCSTLMPIYESYPSYYNRYAYIENDKLVVKYTCKATCSNGVYEDKIICPCGQLKVNVEHDEYTPSLEKMHELGIVQHVDDTVCLTISEDKNYSFYPLKEILDYAKLPYDFDKNIINSPVYNKACKGCTCFNSDNKLVYDPSKFNIETLEELKMIHIIMNHEQDNILMNANIVKTFELP